MIYTITVNNAQGHTLNLPFAIGALCVVISLSRNIQHVTDKCYSWLRKLLFINNCNISNPVHDVTRDTSVADVYMCRRSINSAILCR